MVDVLEAIYRRRSIRNYISRPVETEKLEELLRAAMAAPSAVNSQPWEFVVVTGEDTLARLRGALVMGRYNAPAAIVVCANPVRARNLAGLLFWTQDCSAAVENMLLAAVGLGLGTVWVGVHPVGPTAALVRSALGIPRSVRVLAVVYAGYPAEDKSARTQYAVERVFWEHYGRAGGD